MPIYEYQCTKCGHQMESLQKISDAPLTECPACHNATLTKLVSAAGFQLKGTGWYITDYSKKGKATESGSDSKSTDSTTATKKSSDSSNSSGAASS